MKMIIRYQSPNYKPELVTGRYVRCEGKKPNYEFHVFETATGTGKYFGGKPGMGGTLREYMTKGDGLPEDLKARCIASKQTEKWDNPNC